MGGAQLEIIKEKPMANMPSLATVVARDRHSTAIRPTNDPTTKRKARRVGRGGLEPSTQTRVLIAPISPALGSSARHQHAVDHVNNAIRLEHVLNRDPGGIALGVADGQRLALEFDRELFAFDGLELGLAAALVGCLPQVL